MEVLFYHSVVGKEISRGSGRPEVVAKRIRTRRRRKAIESAVDLAPEGSRCRSR